MVENAMVPFININILYKSVPCSDDPGTFFIIYLGEMTFTYIYVFITLFTIMKLCDKLRLP